MLLGQDPHYEATVKEYGFVPASFSALTVLTSMFLHGGFMHLLGNMWFLYLFGDNVENRCEPFKYLIAYLLRGVAGCFSHLFFFPDSTIPSIGASGAIFGVLGVYLFLFPANRVRIVYLIILFGGRIAVPALWVIGLWFAMELFYSRLQTVAGVESGIGHLAPGASGLRCCCLATAAVVQCALAQLRSTRRLCMRIFSALLGSSKPAPC